MSSDTRLTAISQPSVRLDLLPKTRNAHFLKDLDEDDLLLGGPFLSSAINDVDNVLRTSSHVFQLSQRRCSPFLATFVAS